MPSHFKNVFTWRMFHNVKLCFMHCGIFSSTSPAPNINNAPSDAPESKLGNNEHWKYSIKNGGERRLRNHPARHFVLSFSTVSSIVFSSACCASDLPLTAYFQFCFDRQRERSGKASETCASLLSCCAKSRINNYFPLWIYNPLRSTTVDFSPGDALNAWLASLLRLGGEKKLLIVNALLMGSKKKENNFDEIWRKWRLFKKKLIIRLIGLKKSFLESQKLDYLLAMVDPTGFW